jgi:hypothetical protein
LLLPLLRGFTLHPEQNIYQNIVLLKNL